MEPCTDPKGRKGTVSSPPRRLLLLSLVNVIFYITQPKLFWGLGRGVFFFHLAAFHYPTTGRPPHRRWPAPPFVPPGCLNNAVGGGGDTGPQVSALLGDRSGDSGTLHLSLWVHNDARVVLKIHPGSLLPSERLALPNYDGRVDLLPQVGLSLLDGGHDHVSTASAWKTVQASTPALFVASSVSFYYYFFFSDRSVKRNEFEEERHRRVNGGGSVSKSGGHGRQGFGSRKLGEGRSSGLVRVLGEVGLPRAKA